MMLAIKALIDMACGALNAWGGYSWHNARRFIMPCVIAAGVSIATGVWWLGLTILPAMGTLCLGYFGPKFWGRGLWLALQATVIGAGSLALGHLTWFLYAPYIVGALLLAGFLYSIEQVIGDAIFGCWLGAVVFLVH